MPTSQWNQFQQQYAGMGYSQKQLGGMYQQQKEQAGQKGQKVQKKEYAWKKHNRRVAPADFAFRNTVNGPQWITKPAKQQQKGGQYGGSSKPVVRYNYVDDSDSLEFDTLEAAVKGSKLITKGFLEEIEKSHHNNIDQFRKKVWDKFLGREDAYSETELRSELTTHMPRSIEISVNGVVDQAASREATEHVKGVVQAVLNLLEL